MCVILNYVPDDLQQRPFICEASSFRLCVDPDCSALRHRSCILLVTQAASRACAHSTPSARLCSQGLEAWSRQEEGAACPGVRKERRPGGSPAAALQSSRQSSEPDVATDGLLQEHGLRLPLSPSLRGRGLHPAQGSLDTEVEVSQFYCQVLKSHHRQSPRELLPATSPWHCPGQGGSAGVPEGVPQPLQDVGQPGAIARAGLQHRDGLRSAGHDVLHAEQRLHLHQRHVAGQVTAARGLRVSHCPAVLPPPSTHTAGPGGAQPRCHPTEPAASRGIALRVCPGSSAPPSPPFTSC